MRPLRRHRAQIVALSVGVVAAASWCSSAAAYTFSLTADQASVTAAPGELNAFDVEDLSGGILISDLAGNAVTSALPPGCSSAVAREVQCLPGVVAAVRVDGGDGNDTLSNGSALARVTVVGGEGNDRIAGGTAGETLLGGAGNDAIQGGDGDDVVDGGDDADQLTGGDGDDVLNGGAGDDRLDGSDGNDTSDGASGADTLTGGAGADALTGGDGNDELSGDDGADSLAGGEADDRLDGGRGADRLDGDAGTDELTGGDGFDALLGGEGTDRLFGGTGNDGLSGEAGADALAGDDGDDELDGGTDADMLGGGGGDDRLAGAEGDDTLAGDAGADSFSGGAGSDRASYATQTAPLSISLDDLANDGADGERDDVRTDIEQVVGGAGPDRLIGSAGADRLDGAAGDDVLDGALGPDVLVGGDGSDTVTYATRRGAVIATTGGVGGEAGERDAIDVTVENLHGGAGSDTLSGAAGVVNVFHGGAGDDLLRVGDDAGETDQVLCGSGADRVDKDARDIAARDCERVRSGGKLVRPAPKPRVFVGARRLRLDASARSTLSLRCAAATDGVCAGVVRLSVRRVAGSAALASASFRIAPQASASVALRPAPRLLRRARHAGGRSIRAWARLRTHDAAGRVGVRWLRVTLLTKTSA